MEDLLPSKNKSPRTRRPWASNVLKIGFRGISNPSRQAVPLPSSQPDQHNVDTDTRTLSDKGNSNREEIDDERVILVAESGLLKPTPPGLDLVTQRVDKDITFHPTSGRFAFRIYSKIGESAIQPLIDRLQRIEQLVDFIDVVKKHEKALRCETVSLGQVIFSYGGATASSTKSEQPDAIPVDQKEKTYRATVDFSGENMTLALERGNPHIRILDSLTRVLNSPLGLDGVATLLPPTLPLLTALNAIEDAWAALDQGEVLIFSRASDWYTVRYTLNLPASGEMQHPPRVTFSVRLAHRRREPWWCIRREKERERNESRCNTEPDDVDTALSSVWDENLDGEQWRGMSTSGIARVAGVVELMAKVDAVMHDYATRAFASYAVAVPPDGEPSSATRRPSSQSHHNHYTGNVSGNVGIKMEPIVIE